MFHNSDKEEPKRRAPRTPRGNSRGGAESDDGDGDNAIPVSCRVAFRALVRGDEVYICFGCLTHICIYL